METWGHMNRQRNSGISNSDHYRVLIKSFKALIKITILQSLAIREDISNVEKTVKIFGHEPQQEISHRFP